VRKESDRPERVEAEKVSGAPMNRVDFEKDEKGSPCKDDESCRDAPCAAANAISTTHTEDNRK
jgi:hypothetical protein